MVNRINNRPISFGKVIEVTTNKVDGFRYGSITEADKKVIGCLNHTIGCSGNIAKIRNTFFDDVFEKDTNNPICRIFGDKKYIITGQEAKDIKKIEAFHKQIQNLHAPEIKSDYGSILRVNMPSTISRLKETANAYEQEMGQSICKQAIYDDERKDNLVTLTIESEGEDIVNVEATKTKKDGSKEIKTISMQIPWTGGRGGERIETKEVPSEN